jgi:hypothetical protein
MGEQSALFCPTFNDSLRVESRADRLSSESGALWVREVIERLGVARRLADRLCDPRNALDGEWRRSLVVVRRAIETPAPIRAGRPC